MRHVSGERELHAAAADRRLANRAPGPLDGVPFTVKEKIDVAGSATTQGVRAFADPIALVDTPAVPRCGAPAAFRFDVRLADNASS